MCINLPNTSEMGAWTPYSSPSPPHTMSLSPRALGLVESICLQSKQATSRWTNRASQVALVKICLQMQETQETRVQSLGQEDPWRTAWQPTPAPLPGQSHGQRSLVGHSPRGHKELDTTERLSNKGTSWPATHHEEAVLSFCLGGLIYLWGALGPRLSLSTLKSCLSFLAEQRQQWGLPAAHRVLLQIPASSPGQESRVPLGRLV